MRPITILCIEDDAVVRHIMTLSLRLDPEVTVVTAEDGESAFSLLQDGLQPDVILIDSQLGDCDGADLLRLMRQAGYRDVPAVFVTGAIQSTDQKRYFAAGAVGVIEKPFDPIGLAKNVRGYLLSR